jgi:hypothetical protein
MTIAPDLLTDEGEPKLAPVEKLVVVGQLLRRNHDVDDLAAALLTELDCTGSEGEQRVVAATANVGAGVEVGAALAKDDLARLDDLAAEALNAEVLGVGIATVTS